MATETHIADAHRGMVRRPERRELVAAGAWLALVVAMLLLSGPIRGGTTAAAGYVLLLLLAAIYIAFSIEAVRERVRATVQGRLVRALAFPALLLAACSLYAAITGLPVATRVGAYAAYLFAPTLVVALAPADRDGFVGYGLLAVLLLWLPFELHRLPRLPIAPPLGVDAIRFVALVLGLYLFLAVRPLDGIGYTFRLAPGELRPALAAFAIYAVVAVPIGLATGFIAWHPVLRPERLLLTPPAIYLLTGVPEELLFRGLLQNLLARRLGDWPALAVASVIFGLAHFPDRRYMVLATLAGVAYGWSYQRTRKITVSAVTHALVDAVWVILLRAPRA